MNVYQIEKVLKKWFKLEPRNCNIEIAGRIFGGRHGEAVQNPVSYFLGSDILRINFHLYEILTIVNPEEVKIIEPNDLVVRNASEVRFGWFYYGRAVESVNWCEGIYRIQEEKIQFIDIFGDQITEEIIEFDDEYIVYLDCN
jgi:hypothetical protein